MSISNRMEMNSAKKLLIFLSFGLFLWVVDSLLDSIFFSDSTFLDNLIFDLSTDEIYMRSAMVFFFILFGLISSKTSSKTVEIDYLQNENRKTGKIMDILPMAVLFVDTSGNISFVNKRVFELTGHDEKAVEGKQWYDILIPDDFKSEARSIWGRFTSGEMDSISNLEIPIQTINGDRIFVLWNAVSFKDEDGMLKGILVSGEDISQLKVYQKEVEESEFLFREVVEFSSLSVALLDSNYRPIYFNRKFTENFGYTLDDIVSMEGCWGFVHPDLEYRKNLFECPEQSSFANERTVVYTKECEVSCKDGSVKYVEFNLTKITDDKVVLLFKDITEMKAAEKALILDELRLEALAELNQFTGSTTHDALNFSLEKAVKLTESQVGYIGFVNEDEAIVNMYGWSKKTMKTCRIEHIKKKFNLEEMGLWGEPIRQRRPVVTNDYAVENRYRKGVPDGHVDISNHLGIPIFDNDKIIMIAGVGNKDGDYDSSDIRQLTLLMEGTYKIVQRKQSAEQIKLYAEELAKNNRELESLDRMKDEFMANITHELKTPLIPIKGYSELLFDGHLGNLEDEQKKSVGIIFQNAERLHKLIDSLLYMQNIHSGNIQYHLDSIDIASVLDKISDELLSSRNGAGPLLKKEYASSLPFICGNMIYLEQVFLHILENAFKFTPPEGLITVFAYPDKNNIHVVVKDTGIGIPKDEMSHIFKRFYQADGSLTRRYGGNGLGLYLSKSVVEAHDGSIWATSEEGEGTELHVLLPTIGEETV